VKRTKIAAIAQKAEVDDRLPRPGARGSIGETMGGMGAGGGRLATRRFSHASLPLTSCLMFVSFEGLDGVGKSTQLRLLGEELRRAGHEVVRCREPGGTPLGDEVRRLVLEQVTIPVDARAEALLFAVSRAQLLAEVIEPALARGAWVLTDRFADSSIAYQGAARGLGVEAVRELQRFATAGRLPDRTILLVGPERRGGEPDRIEAEDEAFHSAVGRAFEAIAADEPDRVALVDASGEPEAVARRVRAALGV
jgi:dTMP kinase